jgi:hypothetical protein
VVLETNHRFIFDWLTSCLNCNLVLNYVGSPTHFSSRDCKMESAISYQNWPENPIMTLFPTDGVVLEVRNRKERCHSWSPFAMTGHIQTISVLLFHDSTSTSTTLFVRVLAIRIGLALCVSNFGLIHSLLLVIMKL